MKKFEIQPNKIYDVSDGSNVFFIRVIERWHSQYKVEIASYPDLDEFSDSDLKFEPAYYTYYEIKHLFGYFIFADYYDVEEDNDYEEA